MSQISNRHGKEVKVSLAKCTMKKIVQASWSYLEGTPPKKPICGARGPPTRGEKEELMDFKRHQAPISLIGETVMSSSPETTPNGSLHMLHRMPVSPRASAVQRGQLHKWKGTCPRSLPSSCHNTHRRKGLGSVCLPFRLLSLCINCYLMPPATLFHSSLHPGQRKCCSHSLAQA